MQSLFMPDQQRVHGLPRIGIGSTLRCRLEAHVGTVGAAQTGRALHVTAADEGALGPQPTCL